MTSFLAVAMTIPGVAAGQAVPTALSQKALIEGRVPVIVYLTAPATPEGLLADSAMVTTQRQGIAAAQHTVLTALVAVSYRLRHRYETLPFLALEVGPGALALLNALSGVVVRVEEDELARPTLAESVARIGGPPTWDLGVTGSGQVVAVLDTGTDKNHSFLTGKVVDEACYSSSGNCPDGSQTQEGSGAGVPCTYAPLACQHGTHVSGIVAGLGASFSGVAKGANLMAIQVFSRFTGANCAGAGEDPCALSFVSDQLAALERVYQLRNTHSFSSVNMSLGGGQAFTNCDGDSRKVAIDNLRSVGIATIVASGNNGFTNSLSAPACISSAISVGSTQDGSLGTTADGISSFSNSASFLSVLAPGEWINSSVPGDGFANFRGTSMASPHVAGAWALLKQVKPSATVSGVLMALQTTGLPITDPRNGITKPRPRLLEALLALMPPPGGFKFHTVAPCRLVDTRIAGGMIEANGFRSFAATGTLAGQGGAPNCGVPAGPSKAVFITVVAVNPSGAGHLTVHPYPSPAPVASILNFSAGQTIAGSVVVRICDSSMISCPFDFTVTMGPAAGHVVIDVTAYTAPVP